MKNSILKPSAYYAFIFCFGALLFLAEACKKKESPPPTAVKKRTMEFKINGSQRTCLEIDTIQVSNPDDIVVEGVGLLGLSTFVASISFPKSSIAGSKYFYKDTGSFTGYGGYSIDTTLYFFRYGKLEINSVGGVYEGTYEFVGKNYKNPADSVFITEGKFTYTP